MKINLKIKNKIQKEIILQDKSQKYKKIVN